MLFRISYLLLERLEPAAQHVGLRRVQRLSEAGEPFLFVSTPVHLHWFGHSGTTGRTLMIMLHESWYTINSHLRNLDPSVFADSACELQVSSVQVA